MFTMNLNFGPSPDYKTDGKHEVLLTVPDDAPQPEWGFDVSVTRTNH